MSDVTPVRKNIQVEEVQFRSAVSESVGSKLGGSINFINDYQYDTKAFFLNGGYYAITSPQLAVDGLYVFPYNVTLINCAMFNIVNGTSGTTELDIKVATVSGGSFTSIFSTTPKITTAAGNNAWVIAGGSGTGLTAPVFSGGTGLYNVNAGSAVRLDKLQAQDQAENCGLLLYFRPR